MHLAEKWQFQRSFLKKATFAKCLEIYITVGHQKKIQIFQFYKFSKFVKSAILDFENAKKCDF